jgi:uncharacterized protein YjbJ (UPF0337 family)
MAGPMAAACRECLMFVQSGALLAMYLCMAINQNEVEGKGRKAIGSIKETVGRVTGNDRLEEQGAAEKTAGGFQAGVGKISRKIEEAVDDTKRDLKKP